MYVKILLNRNRNPFPLFHKLPAEARRKHLKFYFLSITYTLVISESTLLTVLGAALCRGS
jgi:hypothetical protein